MQINLKNKLKLEDTLKKLEDKIKNFFEITEFRNILEEMNALPNVVVRYSSDDINGSLDIFDIKENQIKSNEIK